MSRQSPRTRLVLPLLCVALLAAAGSRGATGAPARQAGFDAVEQPSIARGDVPSFAHVVVVVFENKEGTQIAGQRSAPTFNALASRHALLDQVYAPTHPSLPNYIALVSGSTQGITSDCTSCSVNAPNLADSLEAAGLTWKTYAEGLPSPGYTGARYGRYAKKHVPFLYFRSVTSSPSRLARIVPFPAIWSDLDSNRLPSFSLVVPDLCSDMHDCPISTGDAWLKTFATRLLASPNFARSVLWVTFDEGTTTRGGGGRVFTAAAGPTVRQGVRVSTTMPTYSILRSIEEAWGLPLLGKSATAPRITGIWR